MVEQIQNKFARFLYLRLYGVYPFYPLSYPTLFVLGMVGYTQLRVRRELALVLFVVRIMRGLLYNPDILARVNLNVPDKYVWRRRRPALLEEPRARTNLLQKAPLTRALRCINEVASETDVFCCAQIAEGTFTTVVTAWPDVTDTSLRAEILRIFFYLVWWIFVLRTAAVYALVTCISIIVGQQFKNLQSYFYSLNEIFQDDDEIKVWEQERREQIYEEAVRTGFKLHDQTLRCTNEYQVTCNVIFSGQILVNVSVLCLLMLQMVSTERTLMNTLAILSTALAVLIGSGLIMWNAGDISVEAAVLPTAMFHCGWHNCRGKSGPRIKRMLVVAMRQSQRPVIISSFGVLEISYQSYLSIVKSSYSVFSLLY
ncbi:uncharacterized protein LOC121727067 [Aricia agestis]|uniref:uncharacterized protein LOC121727067 n=1 Tax=Aricia agestis TaxID=91739 RepID=UPI001C205A54|nr:uncharacterized protein LOC121727067 [Aricia agestis]